MKINDKEYVTRIEIKKIDDKEYMTRIEIQKTIIKKCMSQEVKTQCTKY